MRILALDSTSSPGSLALLVDGRVLVEDARPDTRPFGARLPGWILDVLARAGLEAAAVDLFVVGAGPGSLTGLRVGIATMQGVSMATGRPLVAESSLEATAAAAASHGLAAEGDLVAAWRDARRGEVFAALYEVGPAGAVREVREPVVAPPPAVCVQWQEVLTGRRFVVAGDAACTSVAAWAAFGLAPARAGDVGPLAGAMARLAAARARAGDDAPPHAVRPLYVRRPDAELARERARAAAGATAHV